ncbi:hypothetical protein OGZ01_32130 [Vibrio harveyi]|nr:hypothetical protein [Vibrio harveyi]
MRSSNDLVEQQELEHRERLVEDTAQEAAISIANGTSQKDAINRAIEKTLGQQEAISRGEVQDDGTFLTARCNHKHQRRIHNKFGLSLKRLKMTSIVNFR